MPPPSPIRDKPAGAIALRPNPDAAPRARIDRLDAGAVAPVFVHSSWRTGSTWLWSRLRQAPTAIAYCEIFHERLESCAIQNLRDNDFSSWNSKHPEGAPYFLEFAPLVEPDGVVRGFDPRMATERFMPSDGLHGALGLAERAYIRGLIENAAQRGKIPVLTDTRTLGRFRAVTMAFPGRHVLLVRNLFHQWASYSQQSAEGNRYFIDMLHKTVAASRRDPFVALIADWFADDDRSETSARLFQLFLLFHLYLYANAYDSSDYVLDINKIAADPESRRLAEARLSEFVHFPIDLSGAQTPFGLSLFSVASKNAFVDEIDQFVKQMADVSISGAAVEFVAEAKDDALAEWERSEFYNGNARSHFVRRLKRVAEALEEQAEARARSDADQKRLQRSVRRLTRERDALAKRFAANSRDARLSPAKSSPQR